MDVDKEGNLKANGIGDTTVKITIDGKTKICNVYVIKSFYCDYLPSSIILDVGEVYTKDFYYFGDDGVTYATGQETLRLSKGEKSSISFYPLDIGTLLPVGNYTLIFSSY